MNVTAHMALNLITQEFRPQIVFLCIDDTTVTDHRHSTLDNV